MVPLAPARAWLIPEPALVTVMAAPPSTETAPLVPAVAGPAVSSCSVAAALPPVTASVAALPSWVVVSTSLPLPSTEAVRSPPDAVPTAAASWAAL